MVIKAKSCTHLKITITYFVRRLIKHLKRKVEPNNKQRPPTFGANLIITLSASFIEQSRL